MVMCCWATWLCRVRPCRVFNECPSAPRSASTRQKKVHVCMEACLRMPCALGGGSCTASTAADLMDCPLCACYKFCTALATSAEALLLCIQTPLQSCAGPLCVCVSLLANLSTCMCESTAYVCSPLACTTLHCHLVSRLAPFLVF